MTRKKVNGGFLSAIDEVLDKKHIVKIGDHELELQEPSVDDMLALNDMMIKKVMSLKDAKTEEDVRNAISPREDLEIVADIASKCIAEDIPKEKLVKFMVKTGGQTSPLYRKCMEIVGWGGNAEKEAGRQTDFPA